MALTVRAALFFNSLRESVNDLHADAVCHAIILCKRTVINFQKCIQNIVVKCNLCQSN